MAAVRAAQSLNLRIPQDISMVGFDRTATDVNISHGKQNPLEVGNQAVERLHRLLRGEDRIPSGSRISGVWVEGNSILDLKHPG